MLSSLFSKPDLIKTFAPLSESGKAYVEIMLVNTKTSKVEGRGFFNDADFLLEACRGLVGRYNFCLSNFAYTQAQIPTRGSYNQFDRTLADLPAQEHAKVHSLSLIFLFKPDLIREMTAQAGQGDPFMNLIYSVDSMLGRVGIKCYSLDYFLTGVVVRVWAPGTVQKKQINKVGLVMLTKKLIESLDKKMTPQEHQHFAVTAAVTGKIWDPAPGLPGMFTNDAPDSMVVTSSGALEPGEDAGLTAFFEEAIEAKKPKLQPEKEAYAPPANIQGLSQSWTETQEAQYETRPTPGLQSEKPYAAAKVDYADSSAREPSRELVSWFQNYLQGKWRWPLYSAPFNKIHQGAACGEMLLLQCDPFAGELAFQFLMQCAEGFCKEGTGQILVFSKKRGLGDLALSSLSRHYKGNPLAGKPAGGVPEATTLARAFDSIFPNPPQAAPCNRSDGLEQLLKYLEHDYVPKQRKRSSALMPLTILIDNIDEFAGADNSETFRALSQMKMRLREFNASLWAVRMGSLEDCAADACVSLADYLLTLDHDGSRDAKEAKGAKPRMAEWEAVFHVDLSVGKLMQEVSLAKIRFQAHGSHRSFSGHYMYHRPSCLFKEISPPAQNGTAPYAASQGSAAPSAPGAPVAGSQPV